MNYFYDKSYYYLLRAYTPFLKTLVILYFSLHCSFLGTIDSKGASLEAISLWFKPIEYWISKTFFLFFQMWRLQMITCLLCLSYLSTVSLVSSFIYFRSGAPLWLNFHVRPTVTARTLLITSQLKGNLKPKYCFLNTLWWQKRVDIFGLYGSYILRKK